MRTTTTLMLVTAFAALVFVAGCVPEPELPDPERTFTDFARELYILNTQAETISVINLDSGEIYKDAFLSGVWPNHMLFHRNSIYLVNSGENSITVHDESTFTFLGEIYLGSGSNPWMIIQADGTDKAYVPNFLSGDVAVIDLYTLDVSSRIPVGKGPEGGAYQDGKVYVCNTSWNHQLFDYDDGTVSVIDSATDAVLSTITVGKNPQSAIPFPALDELHVICTGKNGGPGSDDGQIYIVDTLTDQVTQVLDIGGSPIAGENGVDEAGKIVYLTGVGGLQSYNYETKTILHSSADYIVAGDDPESDLYSGVAVDEAGGKIYVGFFTDDEIVVVDKDDHSILEEIAGSDGTHSLYIFTE